MKISRSPGFVFIGGYTIFLMLIEFRYSQQVVRQFFTDIKGDVPFYAINTSLCVFLLWATALLFAISIVCINDLAKNRKELFFYLSQIFIFGYLGCDDRFLFHENIANFLNIHDALILLGIGLAEIVFLFMYGEIRKQPNFIKKDLIVAVFLFGIMIVIDAFLPSQLRLRLSVEDLAKLWADVFLFLFAWDICCLKINQLKAEIRANKETPHIIVKQPAVRVESEKFIDISLLNDHVKSTT